MLMHNTPLTTREHYRLFSVGPQLHSLTFDSAEAEETLILLCDALNSKIGLGQHLTWYPHRVYRYQSWSLHLTGNLGTYPLLLNISGRFRLPIYTALPVRWVIDMSDHIDAYWFVQYLMHKLNLSYTAPDLSTLFGDKTVYKSEVPDA